MYVSLNQENLYCGYLTIEALCFTYVVMYVIERLMDLIDIPPKFCYNEYVKSITTPTKRMTIWANQLAAAIEIMDEDISLSKTVLEDILNEMNPTHA